jgi:hypothetical protein
MLRPSPVVRSFFATTTAHDAHFCDDTSEVPRRRSDVRVVRESDIDRAGRLPGGGRAGKTGA